MYLTREPITLEAVIARLPQQARRCEEARSADAGCSSGGWPLGPPVPDGRSGEATSEGRDCFGPSGLAMTGSLKSGATVLFLGTVRDHSEGKKVLFLDYEAYEEMAEQMLGTLVREAFERWALEEIRLVHRLGRVNLGEIAVAIAVESAHRDEAYQVSRFLIEGIKHKVPIWKKEYFADGTSEWSQCGFNYAHLH